MAERVVDGLADINAFLQLLPVKIEANVLRGGLRAGAKVFLDEARRLCPEAPPSMSGVKQGARSGELKRSLRISMRSTRGVVRAMIKAGNKKAWYAHLVEYGTAGHWIRSRYGKELLINGRFRKVVWHPGAKRKPFMRPAFDSKSTAAVDAMADYMRNRLPKEFAKLK